MTIFFTPFAAKEAAFGEKMKWEVVGVPVEQKQALKADKYEECWALGEEMAKKLKTEN